MKRGQRSHLTLRFTGRHLIMAGGNTIHILIHQAASGKEGEYEPIPRGEYWIQSDEIYNLVPTTDMRAKMDYMISHWASLKEANKAHKAAWGNFRIPIRQSLTQETVTKRKNMFFHGGDVYGSAGCIDLAHNMDSFVNQLKTELPPNEVVWIPLIVE